MAQDNGDEHKRWRAVQRHNGPLGADDGDDTPTSERTGQWYESNRRPIRRPLHQPDGRMGRNDRYHERKATAEGWRTLQASTCHSVRTCVTGPG